MYYEEKVIDGVLCWRNTPDGEWVQCSKKNLTEKFIDMKAEYETSHNGWMIADTALCRIANGEEPARIIANSAIEEYQ